MSSAEINTALNCLTVGACGVAVLRLWRAHLHRKYRALFWFLLCVAAFDAIIVASHNANFQAPAIIFEVFQPLTWFFSVWVVLELYGLILERYKGLATLGRWVQYAGFTLSTLISLLAMLPKIRADAGRIPPLAEYYFAIERGIDCGMLIFLLVILAWLSRYPVPLSRNVVVHCVIYSILFFSNSVGMFGQLFFGFQISIAMNLVLIGIFAVSIFGWALFLSEKGEEIRVTVPTFSPEQESRILNQLEALNAAMLKASRN